MFPYSLYLHFDFQQHVQAMNGEDILNQYVLLTLRHAELLQYNNE